MNEQLVVKNFGPIKDATVDFKRVTVFIGPTGGGKSTLAKLAAVFRNGVLNTLTLKNRRKFFDDFSLENFFKDLSLFQWKFNNNQFTLNSNLNLPTDSTDFANAIELKQSEIFGSWPKEEFESLKNRATTLSFSVTDKDIDAIKQAFVDALVKHKTRGVIQTTYLTSYRVFLPAVEYSWAGILRDDIGLPKDILDFANSFSLARKEVTELDVSFLNAKYLHRNGQDFIKIPESETLFRLYEAASGIQSVTPLLVLLEHLSRNTEQAQSFIIEEPELNLFPTAQFELVKTLVDKCARLEGQNDLVLTTHSPYVLTALNLLCYAYRIAQQDEATARKVAKIIPRHCWIDPEQFAAYYVDLPTTRRKEQVRSIINKKTGLIEENELDTASEELAGIFDKLLRLRQPTKPKPSARANA